MRYLQHPVSEPQVLADALLFSSGLLQNAGTASDFMTCPCSKLLKPWISGESWIMEKKVYNLWAGFPSRMHPFNCLLGASGGQAATVSCLWCLNSLVRLRQHGGEETGACWGG